MLRLAVCDDLTQDLDRTKGLLEAYCRERPGYEIELRFYATPYRILTEAECGVWHDIYLLDILMPGMNGVELGKAIRRRNGRCVILFGTITPEYALDAFQAGPQNYLLKPFQQKALFETLDRAVSFLDTGQSHGISIRTPGGVHFIPFHSILYIENRRRRLELHLLDGRRVDSVQLRGSFEEALDGLISDPRFCQPHKSFVVNMDHVRFQGGGHMEVLTGVAVPVSPARRTAVLDRFLEYSVAKNK